MQFIGKMRSLKKEKTRKPAQSVYDVVFRKIEPKWYKVFFARLKSPVTFWLCVFFMLFFYLQKQLAFHFYYIEQEQLYLWSRIYWASVLMEPAGLSRLLTEFCVQFFILPYCGALIMSALFTSIGLLTAGIIKRIAPTANLFLLSLLPIVFLLYIHFDINYFYKGTIAYLLMLLVMYGSFCISRIKIKVIYVTIWGILLFWWAGGVAFLFVVCVFLWELISRFSRAYGFIFPLLIVIGMAAWSVYTSITGNFSLALLPDGYFTHQLRPVVAIYFPWICLLFIILICRLFCHRKKVYGGRKFAEFFFQLILIVSAFWFGINKYANRYSDFYKELDYYMRTEQWDRIIERCSGETNNYLYKCCLNIALAEKDELSDRMFSFNQNGIQSIHVTWNRTPHVSTLLSDLFFSMGHIALSQRMAFEACVSMPNSGGSRMLKRLIQTNLIYGAYPVAEKYLDLLEQTKYYHKWAQEHRQFLWNDEAIMNDSLLSIKRNCIPKSNLMSEIHGVYTDLEIIAKQNPEHKATIQYAGALCLLSKELTLLEKIIRNNYRTEVLPTLPEYYQEAIVILSEKNPSYLELFDISESVIQRFNVLRRQILSNRNNSAALPGLLKNSYGDTYWYYYLYK